MLRIVAWISLIMLVAGIVLVVYKTPWVDLDYQDDYDGGG